MSFVVDNTFFAGSRRCSDCKKLVYPEDKRLHPLECPKSPRRQQDLYSNRVVGGIDE